MKLITPILILTTALIYIQPYASICNPLPNDETKIILQCRTLKETRDSIEISYTPLDYISIRYDSKTIKKKRENGMVEWVINSGEPYLITSSSIPLESFFEPGDSIAITYLPDTTLYSGHGFTKFVFLREFEYRSSLLNSTKPIDDSKANLLTKYMAYNKYLDKKEELLQKLLLSYQGRISGFAYNYMKVQLMSRIEDERLIQFNRFAVNSKKEGISNQMVCKIFDLLQSSPYSVHLHSQHEKWGSVKYYYRFIRALNQRKYNFELDNESIKDEDQRKVDYYYLGQQVYQGEVLENFLAYLLTEAGFNDLGFKKGVNKILADYYQRPGNIEYKKYVEKFEAKRRIQDYEHGFKTDFHLTDATGHPFTIQQLQGKIILLNFWSTGSITSKLAANALNNIQAAFKKDSLIVFVNISTDKNKIVWQNSVKQSIYTPREGIQVYTSGLGISHPVISSYEVLRYPALCLINSFGEIIQHPLPDANETGAPALIRLIQEQSALRKSYDSVNSDGPHLLYKDKSLNFYTITNSIPEIKRITNSTRPAFTVLSGNKDATFQVKLKPSLTVESATYARPKKLLVLSDIEGNFNAFKGLLIANGVIDSNYNWTFGEGHLVLTGDMVDRGSEVTECLWLIYSLEEKASSSRGYVHYILGNHEIMNLSGNTKYVNEKYLTNAQKFNLPYKALFTANSELGRWLRTKNVLEKIGDLLFTHGGISPQLNKLAITVDKINDLSRRWYSFSDSALNHSDTILRTLYSSYTSPFWYRHYYKEDHYSKTYNALFSHATQDQIDSSLIKFNVAHILTGHTIISDSISIHYNGKVINTDTHHAEGKSEALLIEGNMFYRTNVAGSKIILFADTKNNSTD